MKERWLNEEDYFMILLLILVISFSIIVIIKINYPELDKKGKTVDNTSNNSNKELKITINEVSIYPNEAIELYNGNDVDINLSGYTLSDKSGKIYHFPSRVISKKGYLVVNSNELGFNINNTDEVISLKKDTIIIDSFNVNKLIGGVSTGISNEKKVYYKNTTLGSKNSDIIYLGYSDTPKFSSDNVYAKVGDKISLSTVDGSKIYYTIDGTFPTLQSSVYTTPITISKNTIIKAFSYKNGYIESDIVSRTYIVNSNHTIPIVSITTDNMSFYENYKTKQEQKANFEFYEANGRLGISFIGDIKVSGWGTTGLPQKNMSLYLRKKYSANKITYPFFSDSKYHTYKSLTLRASGADSKYLHIKEGLYNSVIKNQIDVDIRDYRPVVVYLNGEYWGVYSLTEKLNSDYLNIKYGIEKDNLDLIKYYVDVFNGGSKKKIMNGNEKEFNKLLSYLDNNDVSNPQVYNYLKSQIDIQEVINYWIIEAFLSNVDYPHNNVKIYKTSNSKWRWIVYDLDCANLTSSLDGFLYLNIDSSTDWVKIIAKLSLNSEFRDLYLTTLGNILKTTFKPDRVLKIIDEKCSEIEREMTIHFTKWGKSNRDATSLDEWKNNISTFKSEFQNRYNTVVRSLKNKFNLNDSDYNKYFGGL